MSKFILPFFLFALMYVFVFLRGVVGGSTAYDQMPMYLANKALSLAAVAVLAIALIRGPLMPVLKHTKPDHPLSPRTLGWTALSMGLGHAVLSVLMMDPAYYAKFFQPDGGRMTFNGELVMISGVAVLMTMVWQGLKSLDMEFAALAGKKVKNLLKGTGLIAIIFTAAHVFLMGYEGWLDFSGWRWGILPPSTFVGFMFILAGLIGHFAAKQYVAYKLNAGMQKNPPASVQMK